MKLAPDWKKIARHSQSFWINITASVLGSIALGFQYLFEVLPVSPVTFVGLLTLLNLAAAMFRLVFQKSLVKEL